MKKFLMALLMGTFVVASMAAVSGCTGTEEKKGTEKKTEEKKTEEKKS